MGILLVIKVLGPKGPFIEIQVVACYCWSVGEKLPWGL